MSTNPFKSVCDLLASASWVSSVDDAVSHTSEHMPDWGINELRSLVLRHAERVDFPCLLYVDEEVGVPVFVGSKTLRLLQDRLLSTLPGDPIAKAMQVCGREHATQEDKGGNAYAKHPLAVAAAVMTGGGSDYQVAAALLHDVVEDTDTTLEELRHEAGFGDYIVNLVDAVSRRPEETAQEYLDRLIQFGDDARALKSADVRHNMDLSRLNRVPEKGDIRRNQVYTKELKRLQEAVDD